MLKFQLINKYHYTRLLALSPLFVKTWRMRTLIKASAEFRRVKISQSKAFLYTLPIVMCEIIILILFTLIDPPRPQELLGVGTRNGSIGVQQVTCEHHSNAFFITQFSFAGKRKTEDRKDYPVC
jgi:hypothetical protein